MKRIEWNFIFYFTFISWIIYASLIFSYRITIQDTKRNLRIEKNRMEFYFYLFSQNYISGYETEFKNWKELNGILFFISFLYHFYSMNNLCKHYLFSQDYISGYETEFKNSSNAEEKKKKEKVCRVRLRLELKIVPLASSTLCSVHGKN